MSVFNLRQMAKGLFIPNEQFAKAREVIARRLLETAVDFINDPIEGNARFNELVSVFELDFGMNHVDQQINDIVGIIRGKMTQWHWDPRAKIKLEEMGTDKGMTLFRIAMDLDATLQGMINSIEVIEERHQVEDVVSDNPDGELINELFGHVSKQSERRVPLLSDRSARPVKNPTWGNG